MGFKCIALNTQKVQYLEVCYYQISNQKVQMDYKASYLQGKDLNTEFF